MEQAGLHLCMWQHYGSKCGNMAYIWHNILWHITARSHGITTSTSPRRTSACCWTPSTGTSSTSCAGGPLRPPRRHPLPRCAFCHRRSPGLD